MATEVATIGEEPPSTRRAALSCFLRSLSVCADYLFGCEEDAEAKRKREAEEEEAEDEVRNEVARSGANTSGSSLEEVTVTTTDSSQWMPTNRGIRLDVCDFVAVLGKI